MKGSLKQGSIRQAFPIRRLRWLLPAMLIKSAMKNIFFYKFLSNLSSRKILNNFGQSVVEYSLIIGIVIAVFIILSPMVKRATQAMVKVVADEVGIQQNAEQNSEAGLISTEVKTNVDTLQRREEWRAGITHSVQATYTDQTTTNTTTHSNLGTRDK